MINIFYVSVNNKKPTVVQYIFIPYNFWLLRSKSMIFYYSLIPVWYQPAGILKPITLSVPIHCQPARTEHFPVATWAVRTTEMREQDVPRFANGLATSCALFTSLKVCTWGRGALQQLIMRNVPWNKVVQHTSTNIGVNLAGTDFCTCGWITSKSCPCTWH